MARANKIVTAVGTAKKDQNSQIFLLTAERCSGIVKKLLRGILWHPSENTPAMKDEGIFIAGLRKA
jgi:hypothetical protein